MLLILKVPFEVTHAVRPLRRSVIPTGTHQVERIPNPLGFPGHWLVLPGTLIGAAESFWRFWKEDPDSGLSPDDVIVVDEYCMFQKRSAKV
jgi:hypothetical protein